MPKKIPTLLPSNVRGSCGLAAFGMCSCKTNFSLEVQRAKTLVTTTFEQIKHPWHICQRSHVSHIIAWHFFPPYFTNRILMS